MNVLPRPISLVTSKLPGDFRKIALVMAKPRPIPLALVENSGSVILLRLPGEIPTPVSVTRTSIELSAMTALTVRVPPAGIASKAFRIRLPNTIPSCVASAFTLGRESGKSETTLIAWRRRIPFKGGLDAVGHRNRAQLRHGRLRETG